MLEKVNLGSIVSALVSHRPERADKTSEYKEHSADEVAAGNERSDRYGPSVTVELSREALEVLAHHNGRGASVVLSAKFAEGPNESLVAEVVTKITSALGIGEGTSLTETQAEQLKALQELISDAINRQSEGLKSNDDDDDDHHGIVSVASSDGVEKSDDRENFDPLALLTEIADQRAGALSDGTEPVESRFKTFVEALTAILAGEGGIDGPSRFSLFSEEKQKEIAYYFEDINEVFGDDPFRTLTEAAGGDVDKLLAALSKLITSEGDEVETEKEEGEGRELAEATSAYRDAYTALTEEELQSVYNIFEQILSAFNVNAEEEAAEADNRLLVALYAEIEKVFG